MENDKPHTGQLTPGTLVNCPTCGLPAEIADRFTLGGAPGPVQHVKVVCTRRHWYTLPVDTLPREGPAPDEADGASIEHRRYAT